MAAFTIVNNTTYPALLTITQGEPGPANISGRVAVAANGGKTVVPASEVFSAHASITMEDGNTYTTAPVELASSAQTLTAQMLVSGGTFNFEIAKSIGVAPGQVTLTSTCRQPVIFTLEERPDSEPVPPSLKCAVVVDPLDTVAISTAKTYTFQAVVNGITTEAVTTDPAQRGHDLHLTIAQDDVVAGDWASYSVVLDT